MKNNAKTLVLLAGLSGVMVGLGNMLGGRGGATMGIMFAVVMNMGAYWFSDKIALKMSRAQPVTEAEAPDLYRTVRNLCARANLPMPTLHVIPSEQPNAFATGRDPNHAAVAVTDGITKLMSAEELEGVLAHELAHVKNRDILITSVAATIAGAISWVATIARWGAFFGSSDDDDGGGLAGVLVATIVAPIAALIIQMAISRSREFEADHDGAEIAGRPDGLASALAKIENYARKAPMPVNPAASSLFIINPLGGGLAHGIGRWFLTHPPTEERIARLQEMVVTG